MKKKFLKDFFGYEEFKIGQGEIIENILGEKHTLVLMPTGGGKSLCFQVPGLMLDGITVVISPLISLMKDQVDTLNEKGITAEYYNSAHSQLEKDGILELLRNGKVKFLYVSPESIFSPGFMEGISKLNISMFAIDEAHCISQWGHDFRGDYLRLSELFKRFPDSKKVALTATADQKTRQDIIDILGMDKCNTFLTSFDRSNIEYIVRKKGNSSHQMTEALKEVKSGSSIIFCLSRKKVDSTSDFLQKNGYKALPYHAGMSRQDRDANQRLFLAGKCDVMVATIAFGMGIDKPDIRLIVHMDIPSTIEGYYQETGRAGRDGIPSKSLLLYGDHDIEARYEMIENSKQSPDKKANSVSKMDSMVGFCLSKTCKRKMLLGYFSENYLGNCEYCSSCSDGVSAGEEHASLFCHLFDMSLSKKCMMDTLLGKKTKETVDSGLVDWEFFGSFKKMGKKKLNNLYCMLLSEGEIERML